MIFREAIEMVKEFEGLRLEGYLCPAGVWTVGYGHTRTARAGMKVTEARALELLGDDLERAGRVVRRLVRVPLNGYQYGALCSFVFNVGEGAFGGSTLLRLLNEGNYAAVPGQLARWNKATVNGERVALAGLTRRRAAEAALWAKGG